MTFKHNCPNIMFFSLHFMKLINSNILGLFLSDTGRRFFLFLTNLGQSSIQWYSSSLTLRKAHSLPSIFYLISAHQPLSTKNRGELNLNFEICTLSSLFTMLRYGST